MSTTTSTIASTATTTARYSTVGKPRRVTDAHIARILDWHRTRVTTKQLARELGISPSTLQTIIRTEGRHYKKASPG